MKRKIGSFVAGLMTGALLLGGSTALAGSDVTGDLREITVYVDGRPVTMEAVNVADTNYVKLRDVGKAVDFNVWWDGEVWVDTTSPYTGEAPATSGNSLDANMEMRQEMIEGINRVRIENGLSALPVSGILMDAAQDISSKGFRHHDDYEWEAVAAYGWPYGGGINLTWFSTLTGESIPQRAVRNWVNSPGHFQTMLRENVTCLGVGITVNGYIATCYMIVGDPSSHGRY